jgi:hypothetical protein
MQHAHGPHVPLRLRARRFRRLTRGEGPVVPLTPARNTAQRQRRLRERVARMLWAPIQGVKDPDRN